MAFTAADVKKLREMTNVGMMDCKKALLPPTAIWTRLLEWLRGKEPGRCRQRSPADCR